MTYFTLLIHNLLQVVISFQETKDLQEFFVLHQSQLLYTHHVHLKTVDENEAYLLQIFCKSSAKGLKPVLITDPSP